MDVQQRTSRRLSLKAPALCAIVVLLCSLAWWQTQGQKKDPAPALVVEDRFLDLGEVWEDEALHVTLPIENRSKADINILGFSTSCSCLSVEPRSLLVLTGQTTPVQVTLNLAPVKLEDRRLATREFEAQLKPAVHKTPFIEAVPDWIIRAKVRPAIRATPSSINFGTSIVRGLPSPSQTTVISCDPSVAELSAKADDSLLEVLLTRSTNEAHDWSLTALPRKDLKEGWLQSNIKLEPTCSDGTKFPSVTVPIRGNVMEEVQAIPSACNFGACQVGETVQQSILLWSASGQSFEIEGIDIPSKNIRIDALANPTSLSKRFLVSCRVEKRGDSVQKVNLVVRTESGRTFSIPVTVHVFGIVSSREKP